MNSFPILGQRVDALDWDSLLETLCRWGRARQSRGVCICNVHSLVTALNSPAHAEALARSDINTPDGMPLVWVLRKNGFPRQRRIAGPDLMNKLCRRAAESGLPVFFLGSTQATLNKLLAKLHDDLPNLKVAGTFSPPFRSLTPEEDRAHREDDQRLRCGHRFCRYGMPETGGMDNRASRANQGRHDRGRGRLRFSCGNRCPRPEMDAKIWRRMAPPIPAGTPPHVVAVCEDEYHFCVDGCENVD